MLKHYNQYTECVKDLNVSPAVLEMSKFIQHSDVSCLRHCRFVSFYSFRLCRALGLDYRSAARGGLLHDLFLYDWHKLELKVSFRNFFKLHGFTHPGTALYNASNYFTLNDKEKDIISKHMWPLIPRLPKYAESFWVSMVDKYVTVLEVTRLIHLTKLWRVNPEGDK
ncbi:MAG: HD family phosphohydrolase [Eubacteriales bacterium]